jgi:hypothetical protein
MIQSKTAPALSLLALGLLAACGGGGSSSSAGGGTVTTLSLQGTAATGAAIAGAAVQAKCSGGSGTATTAADGTYTINLSVGTLPCVLEVSPTGGGSKLYSVATGSGATATSNITPLTQLVVAKIVGADPATYFAGLAATDLGALSSTTVSTAQAAVIDTLKNNGVDASALGDLVSGTLVAASAGKPGNGMDVVLDALGAKLVTANVTLSQLTTLVAQTTAAPTPTDTATVPVDVALQPSAATCPVLRSGTYRTINPQIGPVGDHGSASTGKIVVDVTAGTIAYGDGTSATVTPVDGSPCQFTTSTGANIVASPAGVLAVESSAPMSLAIVFPEQNIRVAELAGDWNVLGFDRATLTDPLRPVSRTFTLDNAGNLTITSDCADAKACVTTGLPTGVTVTANSAGGFDTHSGGNVGSRAFAYRSGNGGIMMMFVAGDGTWGMATRARANPLPTVGTVNLGWNVGAVNVLSNGNYQPAGVAINDYNNTITAADPATGVVIRDNVTNFATTPMVSRPETIEFNSVAGVARTGYRYRRPGPVTNSAGATVNVPEFIAMNLVGMGMNAVALPGNSATAGQFIVSVVKP